ncbi:MAG: hypothetical protein NC429_16645 [Lachnospiraceae bacterium]|nr:hypothetical protein [Lachnospiraceae bacterium]
MSSPKDKFSSESILFSEDILFSGNILLSEDIAFSGNILFSGDIAFSGNILFSEGIAFSGNILLSEGILFSENISSLFSGNMPSESILFPVVWDCAFSVIDFNRLSKYSSSVAISSTSAFLFHYLISLPH